MNYRASLLLLTIALGLFALLPIACGDDATEQPSPTVDAGPDTADDTTGGLDDVDTHPDTARPDTDTPDTSPDVVEDTPDDTDLDATDTDLDAEDADPDAEDADPDAPDDATADADLDATDAAEDTDDATTADADPDATPITCATWDPVDNAALLTELHRALSDAYRPIQVENDLGGHPNRYTTARHLMFSEVEWFVNDGGESGVECVYTGFFQAVERGTEPDNNIVNCEHGWPRARMDSDRSSILYSHQQSDLNILLPSQSGANSLRGDLPFGEPVSGINADYFPARAGLDAHGNRVFEPRPERRGDMARITFYFATRWGKDIGADEEAVLRAWAAADPVDDREGDRNDVIESLQGNRNPYVDCPDLLGRVPVFDEFPILDTNETLPAP